MLPGRAVVAASAGQLRPAPDALALARHVAMLACRRMMAPRAIAHRAAPFADLTNHPNIAYSNLF